MRTRTGSRGVHHAELAEKGSVEETMHSRGQQTEGLIAGGVVQAAKAGEAVDGLADMEEWREAGQCPAEVAGSGSGLGQGSVTGDARRQGPGRTRPESGRPGPAAVG